MSRPVAEKISLLEKTLTLILKNAAVPRSHTAPALESIATDDIAPLAAAAAPVALASELAEPATLVAEPTPVNTAVEASVWADAPTFNGTSDEELELGLPPAAELPSLDDVPVAESRPATIPPAGEPFAELRPATIPPAVASGEDVFELQPADEIAPSAFSADEAEPSTVRPLAAAHEAEAFGGGLDFEPLSPPAPAAGLSNDDLTPSAPAIELSPAPSEAQIPSLESEPTAAASDLELLPLDSSPPALALDAPRPATVPPAASNESLELLPLDEPLAAAPESVEPATIPPVAADDELLVEAAAGSELFAEAAPVAAGDDLFAEAAPSLADDPFAEAPVVEAAPASVVDDFIVEAPPAAVSGDALLAEPEPATIPPAAGGELFAEAAPSAAADELLVEAAPSVVSDEPFAGAPLAESDVAAAEAPEAAALDFEPLSPPAPEAISTVEGSTAPESDTTLGAAAVAAGIVAAATLASQPAPRAEAEPLAALDEPSLEADLGLPKAPASPKTPTIEQLGQVIDLDEGPSRDFELAMGEPIKTAPLPTPDEEMVLPPAQSPGQFAPSLRADAAPAASESLSLDVPPSPPAAELPEALPAPEPLAVSLGEAAAPAAVAVGADVISRSPLSADVAVFVAASRASAPATFGELLDLSLSLGLGRAGVRCVLARRSVSCDRARALQGVAASSREGSPCAHEPWAPRP